jgi:hypothetical protein
VCVHVNLIAGRRSTAAKRRAILAIAGSAQSRESSSVGVGAKRRASSAVVLRTEMEDGDVRVRVELLIGVACIRARRSVTPMSKKTERRCVHLTLKWSLPARVGKRLWGWVSGASARIQFPPALESVASIWRDVNTLVPLLVSDPSPHLS